MIRRIAMIFVGAAVFAFAVLRNVGGLVQWIARRSPRVRSTALRLAIGNIHRPGALTPSVVLSLGLGLTLLVTLALIETLIGKGMQVMIFDREVELASLFGANKSYIEQEIPHISSLMKRRIDEVIEQSEVVVLTKGSEEYRAALERVSHPPLIIDLARVLENRRSLALLVLYGVLRLVLASTSGEHGLLTPEGQVDLVAATLVLVVLQLRLALLFLILPAFIYRLVVRIEWPAGVPEHGRAIGRKLPP